MNRRQYWLALLLLVGGSAWAASNSDRDFSRYQLIIDRLPFGGSTGGGPAANQPNFAGRFTLVGMVSSNFPGGRVQAIILDKSASNRTHFKSEGEMMDGVKVLRINDQLPNRSVVLQQGLETATLTYEARRATAPARLLPGMMPGAPMPEAAAEEAPASSATTTAPLPSAPRRIPFRR